jgi:hypothetical protein
MQIQRMIWFGIAVSTLFYGGIIFAVANKPTATFEAAVRSPMVLGPYVMAALIFMIGLLWPMISSASPARVKMIIRMALFEACAIFGLVAAFISHDFRIYLAPWALAAAGFFLAFPTAERQL